MEHQPPHSTPDSAMHNFLTFVFFSLAGIGQFFEHVTAESVYTWIFRIISLVSVIMVIVINWPKFKEALKRK